jgi:hypothetical protein
MDVPAVPFELGDPGRCAVIGRDAGGVEARELEAAVAIGGAHHGDPDALTVHSGDAAGPFALDGHAAFEGKAELGEELNGGIEVFHHDTDVVHALELALGPKAMHIDLRQGAVRDGSLGRLALSCPTVTPC